MWQLEVRMWWSHRCLVILSEWTRKVPLFSKYVPRCSAMCIESVWSEKAKKKNPHHPFGQGLVTSWAAEFMPGKHPPKQVQAAGCVQEKNKKVSVQIASIHCGKWNLNKMQYDYVYLIHVMWYQKVLLRLYYWNFMLLKLEFLKLLGSLIKTDKYKTALMKSEFLCSQINMLVFILAALL